MRPRVDWMNQTDDRILEVLEESGLILSPMVIAKNLEYSRSWISERISKLENSGLIEEVDSGYYMISDTGIAYIEGEIDPDDIKNPE